MNDIERYFAYKNQIRNAKYKKVLIITVILFIVLLFVGWLSFLILFNLTTVDALYTAVLVMTSIDVEVTPVNDGQKIFIMIYALLVVVLLLAIVNVAVSYFFTLIKL